MDTDKATAAPVEGENRKRIVDDWNSIWDADPDAYFRYLNEEDNCLTLNKPPPPLPPVIPLRPPPPPVNPPPPPPPLFIPPPPPPPPVNPPPPLPTVSPPPGPVNPPEEPENAAEEWERRRRQIEREAPLVAHAQALLRGERPPPLDPRHLPRLRLDPGDDFSDDSDDDFEGYEYGPRPDLGCPMVEVFAISNFLFVAAEYVTEERNNAGGFHPLIGPNIHHLFPEFAIDMGSAEEAQTASELLLASVDNFWNNRVVLGHPPETFAREFFEFLLNYEQGGNRLFHMGMRIMRAD